MSCRCPFSSPPYKGEKSNHFDGRRFFNAESSESHGPFAFFKWRLSGNRSTWPDWVEIKQSRPAKTRVAQGELTVTFVNHATVLVQVDGINFLTDPIWSKRCSPVSFAGPKRVHAPGIRFEDLPPIDFVLISHNHYDHLDLKTLKKLAALPQPPHFFMGLGTDGILTEAGINPAMITAMDWWQESSTARLPITFVPAKHFAARSVCDRNINLWGGFVVKSSLGPIYFAGDTAFGKHYQEIYEKFGEIRLAILPIGAYEPRWLMKGHHMNPEEAVQASEILKAKQSLAIHFGTFQLTDEAREAPAEALRESLRTHLISLDKFWVLDPGQSKQLDQNNAVDTPK